VTERETRAQLLELIKKHAVLHGDFTLKSGKKSSYYIDMRLVTLEARAAHLIGQVMLAMVQRECVGAIGGPTIGADPIVGATLAVAGEMGVPLAGFLVRKALKEHGTQRIVEGPAGKGARVLIVEDTVTTGGSMLRACEEVKRLGCEVAMLVPIVDRLQGSREAAEAAGFRFEPIFTIHDLGLGE